MKLTGSEFLARDAATAFDSLLDPEVLVRCIPGCESMTRVEDGSYETLIKAGVGPVKGKFTGVVTVTEVVTPESYRMSVSGKSTAGFIQGGAAIRLEEAPGGTTIHYDGEAKVSGLLASVGGRLIDVAAKKVAREFFEKLAVEVAGA